MSIQYRATLMAMLLPLLSPPHAALGAEPDSTNSISAAVARQGEDGTWLLEVDYFYSGTPAGALFQLEVPTPAGMDPASFHAVMIRKVWKTGAAHDTLYIAYPGEGTSQEIVISMTTALPESKPLVTKRIAQVIKWPTRDEKDFQYAIDAIDNGSSDALNQARPIVERLIAKDPKFDAGYVELARIAMKSSWGPAGLHQAETLLDSARQIRPDSANAKILLGYVYAHQGRYKDAEALFADVARSNPPNLWLWTNWGEALQMQGNVDQAIVKYREAITRPAHPGNNYLARRTAFAFLIKLLAERGDPDALEAAYKQRLAEFGPSSCFSADYAFFKLNVRRDPQGAIELARTALELNCDDTRSRQILGLASYVKWAEGNDAGSTGALNQARIFLPTGPNALYLLADSENTVSGLKKLLATGEAIDQKDNEEMTALALALQAGRLEAVERLLKLGARADIPVGIMATPVALLPVFDGNLEAIRVLRRGGVDYTKLRYHGATALDLARQMADPELLRALQDKQKGL